MLSQEKFPKLSDPEFYLDFAGRYARAGWSFFNSLECWCSFFAIVLTTVLAIFLLVTRLSNTHEMHSHSSLYWIVIAASFMVQVRILRHVNKELPRWRIARYYRDIAQKDIYELEKEYRYADSVEKAAALMDHLRAFQEKFPIEENALAAIIYNECLTARGEFSQRSHIDFRQRLFSRFAAFFGGKSSTVVNL